MSENTNLPAQKQPPKSKLVNQTLIAAMFFFVTICCCSGIFLFQELISNQLGNPLSISWGELEGITSLITIALVIAGLVFAFEDRRQKEKEERQENKKISYQHFETIHNRLTSPEQEAARRWIYENIPLKTDDQPLEDWMEIVNKAINTKPKAWTEPRTPGQIYMKMVLNDLDFIGFMFNEYWDAEEKEIEWFTPPIAKTWQRLAPYVAAQREARGEPDYYQAASIIGDYAVAWRNEHGYEQPNIIKETI